MRSEVSDPGAVGPGEVGLLGEGGRQGVAVLVGVARVTFAHRDVT